MKTFKFIWPTTFILVFFMGLSLTVTAQEQKFDLDHNQEKNVPKEYDAAVSSIISSVTLNDFGEETLVYDIEINNQGTQPLHYIYLKSHLQDGLQYISHIPVKNANIDFDTKTNTLSALIPELGVFDKVHILLTVQNFGNSTVFHTVEIVSMDEEDANPLNNSSTVLHKTNVHLPKQSLEVKEGTKGIVYQVIVENPQKGEPGSHWVLKVERDYLPVVFEEGQSQGLVSGSEIEVKKIADGQIAEYIVINPYKDYQPKYTEESKMGGHILMVPLYNDIAGQQDLMNGLDWPTLGERIGDFYRDISNDAYDLSIIHVAEAIQSDISSCYTSNSGIDLALLQQGYDVETYNHVVYLYPPEVCNNGRAIRNGNRSATDLFSVAIISHEIGHNIGWDHDNSGGDEWFEYGNYVSVMGRGFVGYNPGGWPVINQFPELIPTYSINLEFPMKPSLEKIQQKGWSSINALIPSNQTPQDFILSAFSTNGDQPNYVDLDGFNDHLEYRCDVGVDTEAVATYPDYRRGLFYFNSGLFMDADPYSDKHYFQPGQTYYKGNYQFSYTDLPGCQADITLEFVPAKNLEVLDGNDDFPNNFAVSVTADSQNVLNYSTWNTGSVDIDEEFEEGLYVRTPGSADWELVPGQTRTVQGLAAGNSLPGSFTWTPSACGVHSLSVRTDIMNNVMESHEDDNMLPESEGLLLWVDCSDYGDAPDPSLGTGNLNYNTIRSDNGARHIMSNSYYLGDCVDTDDGSLQNDKADADDAHVGTMTFGTCAQPGDDDDGAIFLGPVMTFNPKMVKPSKKVKLRTATGGRVNAWIDWNKNGDFTDPGEHIISTDMDPGTDFQTFTYDTPAVVPSGYVYARVRISNRDVGPTGFGERGEVEDYRFSPTGSIPYEPCCEEGG